jgi:NAD+ diphosphatase
MQRRGRSPPNVFASGPIDRVTDKRRDAAWVEARLQDEATRFVPVWQLKNLFTADQDLRPIWLTSEDVQGLLDAAESTTLLGLNGDRGYFAVSLFSEHETPPFGLGELGQFQELRQIAAVLEEPESAILAYARAMAYWHHRHRFCGDCGAPTASLEAGHSRVCRDPACGQRQFPRTDPAIIVLVRWEEQALLGRKPMWPPGQYSTIAGYVEPGESLEDAVAREVGEETGVRLRDMRYHSSQPWPFPSSLMLGFTAQAAGRTIQVDEDELEHARWFTRAEVRAGLEQARFRLPPSVSISFRLIEDWFDAGDQGQLCEIVVAAAWQSR